MSDDSDKGSQSVTSFGVQSFSPNYKSKTADLCSALDQQSKFGHKVETTLSDDGRKFRGREACRDKFGPRKKHKETARTKSCGTDRCFSDNIALPA